MSDDDKPTGPADPLRYIERNMQIARFVGMTQDEYEALSRAALAKLMPQLRDLNDNDAVRAVMVLTEMVVAVLRQYDGDTRRRMKTVMQEFLTVMLAAV